MDMNLFAIGLDTQFVKCAQRAVCLAMGGTKAGKIMSPDQKIGGLLHGISIQCRPVVPDAPLIQRRGLASWQNAVKIPPSGCRKPGMEISWHFTRRQHRDRVITCQRIQRLHHAFSIKLVRHIQMRCLTCCMNA